MGNTQETEAPANAAELLTNVLIVPPADIRYWSHQELATFVATIENLEERSTVSQNIRFKEVDGPGLSYLTERRDEAVQKLGLAKPEDLDLIWEHLNRKLQESSHRLPLRAYEGRTVPDSIDPLEDKIRGALWGLAIGDALSMPVHWEYQPEVIKANYGTITSYHPAPDKVSNTIMANHWSNNKHRVQELVGVHVMHGKEKDWAQAYTHYHKGMEAGENTLNARLALQVIGCIAGNQGKYDPDTWVQKYVEFLTTPNTHNDTYLEAIHRQFLANYFLEKISDPRACAGAENHDTAAMGGLTSLPPIILSNLQVGTSRGLEAAKTEVKEHMRILYKSGRLEACSELYTGLLYDVILGRDIKEATQELGLFLGRDLEAIAGTGADDVTVCKRKLGLACYIHDSFPVVLYLAHRHGASFDAVHANTNIGGDNCDRGMTLGALCGACVGFNGIPKELVNGLSEKENIETRIEAFIQALKDKNKIVPEESRV